MTTAASSTTTTLTAGSPLLDIVLCSSLSATAEDRGKVDSVTDQVGRWTPCGQTSRPGDTHGCSNSVVKILYEKEGQLPALGSTNNFHDVQPRSTSPWKLEYYNEDRSSKAISGKLTQLVATATTIP
ncbi:unnamed protein product [Sphagnum jensenii]|uniref:Uncharacterized protein n=1 Tax=Sphagnum jensenii TaxID=128206 RepID=A0ABP0ZX11_9BRYO